MMMDGRKPEVMVAALLSIIFEVHHLYSEKIFGFIVTEVFFFLQGHFLTKITNLPFVVACRKIIC